MMTKADAQSSTNSAKRSALANALADIALLDGLDALSLRPAAARLGTSDRMLLYYFGTKAELIANTLETVSARLASKLAGVPETPRLHPFEMIETAAGLLAGPSVRPFMVLWAEILARAVRGDNVYKQVAAGTMMAWIDWIIARTAFPAGVDPTVGATALLTVIEGQSSLLMLNSDIADSDVRLAALQACIAPQQ